MQNYRGNANGCVRPGNTGRYSRMNGCPNVSSEPSFVSERNTTCTNCDALDNMEIAMAYVPWQEWRKILCPEKAFMTGTIFEELNKPFCGAGGYR